MTADCGCGCGGAASFVFSCSGGADVGELADRVARRLDREGVIPMYCLAGVGGRVSGIVKTTEAAGDLLVIDGCPLQCGASTLREAGIERFHHIVMTELGFAKGETPVTEDAVGRAARAAAKLLESRKECGCDTT